MALPRGFTGYADKYRLFSDNAKRVLLFGTVNGLTFGVFRLLFNFYVLSLGRYDETFLGSLTSLSSLASLIVAIPAAYLAERFSQKKIMVITGVASILFFVGIVFSSGPFKLQLFKILMGVATSIRSVAASPYLMSNTGNEERQYVFSLNFGLNTLAGFVGNSLGGVLPIWFGSMVGVSETHVLAYRLALGSMVIISVIGIFPLLKLTDNGHNPANLENFFINIRRHGRKLIKYITPQFIIGMGAGMTMPFMNIYYREVFNQSDAAIGTIFAFGSFFMAIAQFMGAPMADRIGKINTTMLTQALSVPFLAAMALAAYYVPAGSGGHTIWFIIAILAYLVRLGLMNLSNPVYQTFVLEQVEPGIQALAASLIGLAFQFGWAFMPSISGWLQAEYGPQGFLPIIMTTAVFYIIAIVFTWIYFRKEEQRG